MSDTPQDFYARRIRAVLRYIGAHLEEELSLEQLSAVAGFSKFHLHRQFRAYTGFRIGQLITLLRLKRASFQLAFFPAERVIDVALDAGFEASESFARAFRRALGQSPTAFRSAPDWERWVETFKIPLNTQSPGALAMNPAVEVLEFPETRVAVLEHRGAPAELMRSVGTFIEWRKSCADSPERSSHTYGVPYGDPEEKPAAEWRFDICGATRSGVQENAYGVVEKRLPGGRCARVRHRGSTDTIGETVRRLYGEWLPQSGESTGDFPVFFHYLARMPRVSEHDQITDVYLPLRG